MVRSVLFIQVYKSERHRFSPHKSLISKLLLVLKLEICACMDTAVSSFKMTN